MENREKQDETADERPMTETELTISNWFWIEFMKRMGKSEADLPALIEKYGGLEEHIFFKNEERAEHLDDAVLESLARDAEAVLLRGEPLESHPKLLKLYKHIEAKLLRGH